jgi:hypothetical protein
MSRPVVRWPLRPTAANGRERGSSAASPRCLASASRVIADAERLCRRASRASAAARSCVNDAPTADDETFDGANGAIGNTSLVVNAPGDGAPTLNSPKKSVTGDILAGDNDIDGPGPLTVTPGTFATNDGGSVTIEADGDFTYINDPADNCADTSDFFDYTLEDSGSPELTDTGRVTIAVAGCVWYVNNNDAAGNSGPPPPRLTPSPRPRPLRATATRCSCSTATTRRPGTAATATA